MIVDRIHNNLTILIQVIYMIPSPAIHLLYYRVMTKV